MSLASQEILSHFMEHHGSAPYSQDPPLFPFPRQINPVHLFRHISLPVTKDAK